MKSTMLTFTGFLLAIIIGLGMGCEMRIGNPDADLAKEITAMKRAIVNLDANMKRVADAHNNLSGEFQKHHPEEVEETEEKE